MSYWLNLTDGNGTLLGWIRLDGLDLRSIADSSALGELVAIELGTNALDAIAALERPEDRLAELPTSATRLCDPERTVGRGKPCEHGKVVPHRVEVTR